jgi:hypothetical protein
MDGMSITARIPSVKTDQLIGFGSSRRENGPALPGRAKNAGIFRLSVTSL